MFRRSFDDDDDDDDDDGRRRRRRRRWTAIYVVGRKGEVGKIVAFEAVATIALQIHAKVYHMVAGIVCFVAVNTRASIDDGSFGGEK